MSALWEQCLAELSFRLEEQEINTWIRPLHAVLEKDELRLLAPNYFVLNEVVKKYLKVIREILHTLGPNDTKLKLDVGSSSSPAFGGSPGTREIYPNATQEALPSIRKGLNPDYTFDNFVEGPSNQMARATAITIAKEPGAQHNPLFLCGGVGLGKTHLMQAVGNELSEKSPSISVLYLHLLDFVKKMVSAIRGKRMDAFQEQHRNVDVLLIDDIQMITNKKQTQQELFFLFNSLIGNKQQMIFAGDRLPANISNLEERLASRFSSGLIRVIHPPSVETAVAILEKKSSLRGKTIPRDVAFYIASHIRANVRVLEGALLQVLTHADFHKTPVTIEVAKTALVDLIKSDRQRVTLEKIISFVAGYFHIKPKELLSATRSRSIVWPRQVAMALCKELTDHSLPEIGKAFSGRNHTTVLHACRKVKKRREQESSFEDEWNKQVKLICG